MVVSLFLAQLAFAGPVLAQGYPSKPVRLTKILTHLGLPARAPPRSPARPLALFRAA